MSDRIRDYKKEYEQYHAKPEQIARRAGRNKARRILIAEGLVKRGDGNDVHHRNHDTTDNSRKNLAVLSKSENRKKQ